MLEGASTWLTDFFNWLASPEAACQLPLAGYLACGLIACVAAACAKRKVSLVSAMLTLGALGMLGGAVNAPFSALFCWALAAVSGGALIAWHILVPGAWHRDMPHGTELAAVSCVPAGMFLYLNALCGRGEPCLVLFVVLILCALNLLARRLWPQSGLAGYAKAMGVLGSLLALLAVNPLSIGEPIYAYYRFLSVAGVYLNTGLLAVVPLSASLAATIELHANVRHRPFALLALIAWIAVLLDLTGGFELVPCVYAVGCVAYLHARRWARSAWIGVGAVTAAAVAAALVYFSGSFPWRYSSLWNDRYGSGYAWYLTRLITQDAPLLGAGTFEAATKLLEAQGIYGANGITTSDLIFPLTSVTAVFGLAGTALAAAALLAFAVSLARCVHSVPRPAATVAAGTGSLLVACGGAGALAYLGILPTTSYELPFLSFSPTAIAFSLGGLLVTEIMVAGSSPRPDGNERDALPVSYEAPPHPALRALFDEDSAANAFVATAGERVARMADAADAAAAHALAWFERRVQPAVAPLIERWHAYMGVNADGAGAAANHFTSPARGGAAAADARGSGGERETERGTWWFYASQSCSPLFEPNTATELDPTGPEPQGSYGRTRRVEVDSEPFRLKYAFASPVELTRGELDRFYPVVNLAAANHAWDAYGEEYRRLVRIDEKLGGAGPFALPYAFGTLVVDFGDTARAYPAFLMEELKGYRTLEELMEQGVVAPCASAATCVGLALMEPLRQLRTCGIVHADLSGRNIMLRLEKRPDGGSTVTGAALVDFGQSKERVGPATNLREGTRVFAAPEMVELNEENARIFARRVDGSADVWSLGAVLYYVRTDAYPPTSPNPRTAVEIKRNGLTLRREEYADPGDNELRAVIEGCTAFNPDDRLALERIEALLEQAYEVTHAEADEDESQDVGHAGTSATEKNPGREEQRTERYEAAGGATSNGGARRPEPPATE